MDQGNLHLFIIFFSMGAKIYPLLFFGMAFGALNGNLASLVIVPKFGWEGSFVFFGFFAMISGVILIFFSKKYYKEQLNHQLKF